MVTELVVYGASIDWSKKAVPPELTLFATATMHEALMDNSVSGYLYSAVRRERPTLATFYFSTEAQARHLEKLVDLAKDYTGLEGFFDAEQ